MVDRKGARSRIELDSEREKALVAAIRAFGEEHLDEPMGELRARLLLDLFLRELAPAVYNQALRDAQAHLQEKLGDMEAELYAPGPGE